MLLVAKHDGAVVLRVPLALRRKLTIGRSPRCDLRLRSGSISRRHALLFRHGERWHLVDTGSRTGVHRELQQVQHVILDSRHWVRLGPAYLWLREPSAGSPRSGDLDSNAAPPGLGSPLLEAASDEELGPGPRLVLADAAGSVLQRFPLDDRDLISIGRGPGCDVLVQDTEVSTLHSVLYTEHRGWYVADAGSDGGTRIEGRPTRRRLLTPDLLVRIGASLFWLEEGPTPPDETAPPLAWQTAVDPESAFFDDPGDLLDDSDAPVGGSATPPLASAR